jgi:ABC-2 type transport system ATP-binding protein
MAIAPTSPPPAIQIEGLAAGYGPVQALTEITLSVRAGETFGLIGLDGAGKTTLLKSILLLVAPSAGSVRLFGASHRDPASRDQLAYLPERFRPPGDLSGHDFLRLTLALHGRRVSRAAAARAAADLELEPAALRRPIRGYAKGMAQKLGVLATLLTDRPLLILDEPLSGLAPHARSRLKEQLAAWRARGRTILLSSPIAADHDQLCDRVAVLHRGRLGYVGTPAGLRQRHLAATLETAFLAEIEPRLTRAVP